MSRLSLTAILLTIILFVIALLTSTTYVWGLNHLHFLSNIWITICSILFAVALYLSIRPISESLLETIYKRIDNSIWGNRFIGRAIIAIALLILFYIFKVEVHFLGDGYTWLSEFSRPEGFIHKWAQPLSPYLIRFIQSIIGEYSEASALTAFRIISYISGLIFTLNIVSIIGYLCKRSDVRIAGLVTFIFSGMTLLFFGYVEFYSILWAFVSLFINFLIRAINDKKFIWLMIISYLLVLAVHVQGIIFLPAVGYIFISLFNNNKLIKAAKLLYGVIAVAGIIFIVWLYNNRIDIEILILPLINGRYPANDYTLFCFKHIKDLINLLFLMFPGILVLLSWTINNRTVIKRDKVTMLLFLASLGSVLFLIIYAAAPTMARDWDVFSITLFAPILFMIYQIDHKPSRKKQRVLPYLFPYIIMISIISISSIAVTSNAKAGEKRFTEILDNYNLNGWVTLAEYYRRNDDISMNQKIKNEINIRFPDHRLYNEGISKLDRGDVTRAEQIVQSILHRNMYNPNVLYLAGRVAMMRNQPDKTIEYLNRVLQLRPHQFSSLNELGRAYYVTNQTDKAIEVLKKARKINPLELTVLENLAWVAFYQGDYKSASAMADTINNVNTAFASGYLINYLVADKLKDRNKALKNIKSFLKHGKGHPRYDSLSALYPDLR